MADNTTLPGTGDIVEDLDTFSVSANHSRRQVVTIGPRDLSAADSIGALTETAPASDTASSGLNGRLQRIAQRITTALTGIVLAAGENMVGAIVGKAVVVSANFTRPTDTNAYASGDLVANSTTAASVVALTYSTAARVSGGSALVRRARIKKSTTSVTLSTFRLHLYGSDPTASTGITNGDNGAWLTKQAGYLGSVEITVDKAFSDASEGIGVPSVGSEILFVPGSGSTIYGLIEARAAYAPGNAEVFTVELEILQN